MAITKLQSLNLTLLELHTQLKNADYVQYDQIRHNITTQLHARGVRPTTVNVWWSRILHDLKTEFDYTQPHSTKSTAQYQRNKRLALKARMEKIQQQLRAKQQPPLHPFPT